MRFMSFIIVFIVFFSFAASASEVQKVEISDEVLSEIASIPEKGIPPWLLRQARGIAIIPNVIKVGFIIGGRHGKGVMLIKNSMGQWSYPFFVTFTGGSIGWQIGAQSIDAILVFRTKRSVEGVKRGKFTLGADASIAAGPVGRHAEAGTDIELKAEILSYSRSRGLFAGISFEGAVLQIDYLSTAKLYNRNNITLDEVINRRIANPSPAVLKLLRTIEKLSKKR